MTIRKNGEVVIGLTPKDLCDTLGIAKSTLLRWEEKKLIKPPSRARITRVYKEEDIRRILEVMSVIQSGNPIYPDSLRPMHPEIAEMDLNSEIITIGLLELLKD